MVYMQKCSFQDQPFNLVYMKTSAGWFQYFEGIESVFLFLFGLIIIKLILGFLRIVNRILAPLDTAR